MFCPAAIHDTAPNRSVVEPTVASSLQQLRLLQRKLDKAQLYATGRLHDLKDTHLTRVQQNEMLRILNKVEV